MKDPTIAIPPTVAPASRQESQRPFRARRPGHGGSSVFASRIIRICFIALMVGAIYWIRNYRIQQLGNEAFVTGYVLTCVCIALGLLGVRKKLIHLSLGPVAHWQKAHHWLGSLCLIIYLMHAGVMTSGWLESALAIVFWVILVSGIVSWRVNRTSPKLLQAAGKVMLRSDIPAARRDVQEDAYRLALRCAGNSNSSAIADLYREKLALFFQSPRSIWYRISPSGKLRRELLAELERLDRYLDEKGRGLKQEMHRLISRRDDLDFQMAIHQRVRFWATFHSCFLGAFVVLAAVHILLAHLYSSHW